MLPAPVKYIPIRNIAPNPHNPRRLFDKGPMAILRESITNLGILVPVTVYPSKVGGIEAKRDKFVLLDGERRWRCAAVLKIKEIPAVIVEQPSEETNILTMFHIHNVREGWQLMPTALKLQTLMGILKVRNGRKLAELTKLRVGQIRRCKILLTFPKRFQNMMLAPPSERMKADFFIELQRIRGPAIKEVFFPWHKRGDVKCIDIFLSKYLSGVINAVTEFRKLSEIYRGCVRKSRVQDFLKQLERLLRNPKMAIDDIDIPGVSFEREFKEIRRSGRRLIRQINSIDAEAIVSDERVLEILRKLQKLIKTKLSEALIPEPKNAPSDS